MSEEIKPKASPKALRYQLAKGTTLELRGFPYALTDALLCGKSADNHIKAIQNWETENNAKVLGTLIVLK